MTEKDTKTQGLEADPKRQASDSLRGYLYQIWHSVNAWLDLADDEILYLEGAEDFDIVSDDTATAVQVKDTQHNITLRSQEVNDAINHYWELQTNHPDRRVKFRLLTRSKIGVEQGNPFGKGQPGLHVWSRCSGDKASITKISEFLQAEEKISEEVTDFLKRTEPQQIYEQLIQPITWETDSKPASFVEQSINEKLVLHGNQLGFLPAESKKVVDSLINEAQRVATQKENRVLTKVRFLEIFGEQITQSVSPQYLRHLQMQATMVNPIGATFIEGSSDITIQSHPHIQTDIPPLYLDVVVPRTDLLTSIQTKLQSEGIAVSQGGVDKGKTTLAKLTANAIAGDWYWLNFTEREPANVAHSLQQLALLISNQSSQANIVLDDLNLQPQLLRAYEEALGVVVYRVLERGAKLLITSQHKPPNNLIRRLGISRSIVIEVPNFTISEIEQFAQQLGCPANDAKKWSTLIQAHTGGHPRLVHARLTRLREEGWKPQDTIENILQTPQEVKEEREAARQLLTDLPEDFRKLLYRLSLVLTFRKDYALNIGEIPKPILHPGDIFSQLVGPWIDRVDETYYTISPLLTNAAEQVWSDESKIKDLHAQIATAIRKAKNLTTIEARAVLLHSIRGQNREGLISVIDALLAVPENNWEKLSQEFSWLITVIPKPLTESCPEDVFVNHLFRSLQYRIAVEVNPEFAPEILEIWDKETKPREPHQLYLVSRFMLAIKALRYYQVSLPVKQMVGYLKEIIDIANNDQEVWQIYRDSMAQLEEHKSDKSNIFSVLFSFIYARRPIYAPFLSDLINALDEFNPKDLTLLLADFEDDIESRLLIDSVWWSEANLEKPDWPRCLQVFDKVIERTLAWGYPHIAAASARGKAIIYDEYLDEPDTAHKVLQDIILKVGPSPVIEEEQAMVYSRRGRYQEALNIYERILPEWNPPSEQLNVGPLEEYRRAAICAAYLDDWEKAATFFETGAKRTQEVEDTERYIGLYADAGFAQFKAGNMSNSINLLNLALQKFGLLPQDNTDVKYFTLKKRLEYVTGWMASYESENNSSEHEEPPAGFCSNPETNEEQVSTPPDPPMEYAWLNLAQIEYKFALGTTVFQQAVQILDRDAYPKLSSFLSLLETQYDFRNKTFDDLPQRIHQWANAFDSIQKSGKGKEQGTDTISIANLSNFASVENIIFIFVTALLVRLPTRTDMHEILAIWRTKSSELPIKENIINALNLIESMLFGDENNAQIVMRTPEANEKRLVAALKVVHNKETSLENLFDAHKFIATSLIGSPWEDFVAVGLAELLSVQWLEKINSEAMSQMNVDTVRQIEQACNSSETGKKKIGQILLAAYPVVSTIVATETLQQFRSWSENPQES